VSIATTSFYSVSQRLLVNMCARCWGAIYTCANGWL